jgi:Cof subfamily protein (haloacid dehalogenase superfamily)
VIRLLAIDIDGTLLDSKGRVPDAHRDAVAEASARGIEIAIATGRSFHFTRVIADALPVPLTLIVNNGAIVKDRDGATHLRHLLSAGAARTVLENTQAYEDSVAVVFDRPDERQIMFERMDWAHPNRRNYYEKNKAYIAPAEGPLASVLTEDPVQLMFNGHIAPMRDLVAALRALPEAALFSVSQTEYERRDFTMVDVNGAGCSKGSTLAKWAAARGMARSEVMAVGDNLNDAEMFDFAGTAIVMGNAADVVKRGRLVTGTNDEGGLADAIRRYVLA